MNLAKIDEMVGLETRRNIKDDICLTNQLVTYFMV
jgi:hypothetical protein